MKKTTRNGVPGYFITDEEAYRLGNAWRYYQDKSKTEETYIKEYVRKHYPTKGIV
jgi:hypothetical protein